MNTLSLQQAVGVQVARREAPAGPLGVIGVRGKVHVEHYRGGKLLAVYDFPNGIVTEGKNKLLDVMFHGATALAEWYAGLIDLTGYTALAATDNYDDIDQAGNGWDEFKSYTVGGNATIRGTWDEGAASAGQITSSTVTTFDITGAGTVKGVFISAGTQAQTKGDHTAGNTLWATALFTGGDVPVQNGDQLKVTYTVQA